MRFIRCSGWRRDSLVALGASSLTALVLVILGWALLRDQEQQTAAARATAEEARHELDLAKVTANDKEAWLQSQLAQARVEGEEARHEVDRTKKKAHDQEAWLQSQLEQARRPAKRGSDAPEED